MKTPNLQAIPLPTPDTSMGEQAKEMAKKIKAASHAVKRSFTLAPDDVAYIDRLAVNEGSKRGKPMSASEALRIIIQRDRSQA